MAAVQLVTTRVTLPLVIVALVTLVVGSCSDGEIASAAERALRAGDAPRPDVIIIAVDGLGRHDIRALGGTYIPTPAFDLLSEEAVVYGDAYAPSPWAGESLAALLSGVVAAEVAGSSAMGASSDGTGRLGPAASAGPLPPTLAEHLEHLGYRTAIAFGHVRHREACSLDGAPDPPPGFQVSLDVPDQDTPDGARAESVTAAALEWLTAEAGPSLLVCSLSDPRPPHYLYEGLVAAADAPYDGPVGSGLDHAELLRRSIDFTDEDRLRLAELHASEVALCERAFDRIAGVATARRTTAPVLVLVGLRSPALGRAEPGSADVGGEGALAPVVRRYGLVPSLSPNALAVPLMIRFPARTDGSERPMGLLRLPVTLLDVAPTLLDALGFEPRFDIDGHSVFPGARTPERDLVARTRRGIDGALVMRAGVAALSTGAPSVEPRLLGLTDDGSWAPTTSAAPGAHRLMDLVRTLRAQ